MIKISYELAIPVDKIETKWKESFIVVENGLACDVNGNPIKGFSRKIVKVPHMIITHNNESVNLKDLNDGWLNHCKDLPFRAMFIGAGYPPENHCITFSGDAYSKRQFDLICEEVVKFLRKYFYVTFDLNSAGE